MNPQRTESRQSVPSWRTLRRWLPAVLAVGLAAPALAQDKPPVVDPPKTVMPMPVMPMPKVEKTYTVSFEGTDWSKVLDWFAKETKLVFLSTEKPTGSLTLKSENKYTLPQLLDLFNEVLAQKNWVIIRREHSFMIHPAETKIPREILHQITIAELPGRGNTEVVQVVIPLKTIVADDIAPQAKKLLSVFGDVTPFGTNQLIIVDKAKNIRNILEFIKEQEGDKSDQMTYAFKHVRASTAAEKLRTLLADDKTKVDVPSSPWGGGQWGGGQWGQPQDQGRGSDRNRQPVQEKRFATVQITVDFQNNTIVLTGPANKVVAAQSLVKEIDKGEIARPVGGDPFWKTYDVSAGTAEPLAKQIMDSPDFKGSNVKTLVNGNDKVMIYGYPADHLDIATFLKVPKTTPPAVEVVSTGGLDAAKTAESLKAVFGSAGLYVEAKSDGEAAVLLRGSAELIAAAKEFIKANAGQTTGQSGNFRTLTIDKANAGVLAEEIVRMMNQMGRPAQLVIPGQEKKPEPMPKPPVPSPKVGIPGNSQSGYTPDSRVHIAAQLVDPLKPMEDPITLTVVGNKIYISGKNEKDVAVAYELLRLYLNPSTVGEEQYTILRLKNVSSTEAAKLINEIFNGPPASGAAGGGQGGRGGGGGLAAFNPLALLGSLTGGGGAPTDPKAGRVRVVADTTSNSLIVVKASALDMLTIKDLLKKSIDDNTPPEGGVAKTWTIAVVNTKASSLVPTIRNVYANKTGRTATRTQTAGFNPFAPQQAAAPQNVALAVDYDIDTNKIVLNCVENDYLEIKKLVEELDLAAKDSGIVVDVVQLKGGVTPSQIEQTINALAGRPPVQPNQGRGGGGGNFGGGQGNFGGGGGNPFGGGGGNFGGGGGNPFGGFGGGGGNPFGGRGAGGGGGRGAGGGGGRQASLGGAEAPHSFNYGDMDVPSAPSVLFDPEAEQASFHQNNDGSALAQAYASVKQRQMPEQLPQIQPGALQPKPPVPPVVPPAVGVPFLSPSSDVQIIPLPELGIVIVRGKNKAEVDAIKALIANIEEITKKSAAINLTMVPLEFGDATQIVFELTQIFSRLQLGTSGTTFPATNLGFGGVGFQGGNQQNQQNRQTIGSILLFPLPRFNAILLGVPESRLEDIKKEIKRLDVPNSGQMKPVQYPLTRATASTVASQIQNFFNQRYPGEELAQNQIRVTFDVASNTVYVQASPADQKDIAELIGFFDKSTSKALSEVKVFRLRNAFSDDLAQVLIQTLTSNALNPALSASAGLAPTGGGNQGGQGQQQGGGLGQGTGAQGNINQGQQRPGGQALGTLTGNNSTGLSTKTVSLRFNNVESGLLEDVHLIPDTRINGIIVTAPAATMRLLEALVTELDGVAAAKSYVNIFTLKKADAVAVQTLITNLFSRSTTGQQGGFNQGGTTTQQGTTRPLLTLTGDPAAGASLIDLRLTADSRTNTLIVAGSQNDLDLIRAVITRLEDTVIPDQRTEVIKLSNAASADVVTAITTFLTTATQQQNTAQFQTTGGTFQTIQRQFVLQAEPVTNTVLVSASPQLFEQIVTLMRKLDASPPQVFVQVLIAEVRLNNTEEMGVEIGLQSNILFARGSVGTSPGTPGFNFNTTAPLPNANLINQGAVAFQGLGNLGVGRTSTTGVGAGGFVLSAANDTFSLLIRALKAQGRVDVLSRPQLTLTDNQTGFFQVGQQFPRITNSTIAANGLAQQGVEYIETGVVLRVTPRISPEGRVLMRVEPSITAPAASIIALGNGITATPIDTQTVETTVQASDGETVVLGGLIRKSDVKLENKIPWFGDLPWVGAAFRYRTQQSEKRELIFIMTPHIVRSEADMARIVAEEAKKMNWSLKDVESIHGHGADVLSGRYHNALLPQQQAPYCPPGEAQPNLMNLPFSPTGQVTPGIPQPAPIFTPPGGTPNFGQPVPPPMTSGLPQPPAGFAGPNQLGVPGGAPQSNTIPTPGVQQQSWNAPLPKQPGKGWTFGGTSSAGMMPPNTAGANSGKPKEGKEWRVYGR